MTSRHAKWRLSNFDTNGFKFGVTDLNSRVNMDNGNDFVTWTWRAGGDKNTFNVDDVGYASAAAAGLTGGSYHYRWCICWNQTRV